MSNRTVNTNTPLAALRAGYGPTDWALATFVVMLAYASGELMAWFFAWPSPTGPIMLRVLERTYIGVFPLPIVLLALFPLLVLMKRLGWVNHSK